jgi:hypothetical protein
MSQYVCNNVQGLQDWSLVGAPHPIVEVLGENLV